MPCTPKILTAQQVAKLAHRGTGREITIKPEHL